MRTLRRGVFDIVAFFMTDSSIFLYVLGLINVILFLATRKALPTAGVLPTFNIPRKPPPSVFIPPLELKKGGVVPYTVSSAGSDKSFGTRDRNSKYDDSPLESEKVVVTNLGGTFKGHNRTGSGIVAASPGPRPTSFAPSGAPRRAPSPPIDRGQMPSRQGSVNSLRDPFEDDRAYISEESESEDEYDGYGRPRPEWQPSLSAYFDDVDLVTPRPDRTRFSLNAIGGANIPPVPPFQVSQAKNGLSNRV